jgi:hypothetical protein
MNPHTPPTNRRQARQLTAQRPVPDAGSGELATTADARRASSGRERASEWTFLTKHAHVLICLEDDPKCRIRALAVRIGMSPRAVLRILDDLERAKCITRRRDRRGTQYEVHGQKSRECPVGGAVHITELLQLIREGGQSPAESAAASATE